MKALLFLLLALTSLTRPEMIDIAQWRASVGHWCCTSTKSTLLNPRRDEHSSSITWSWFFVSLAVCNQFKWIPLLLLLSGDIELNPGPINDKPTIRELTRWLAPLVQWQEFGHWLPHMPQHEIPIIEANESKIEDKKRALYNKWLAVHHKSTWGEVVAALEKIEENQLAENIRTELSKPACEPGPSCQDISCRVTSARSESDRSRSSVKLQKESIAFETEEQEIEVKLTLEELEKKFSSLLIKLQFNLDKLAKNPDIFKSIIRWMKIRTRKSHELSRVKTLDDAFKIIEPSYDFIDCRLIVDLSEEFPIKDKELVAKFKEYKKEADELRRSTKVGHIAAALRNIFKDFIPDLTSMPQIVLQLHDKWYRSNIAGLSLLIRQLLPDEFQQSIMKYITILTGSVIIKYTVLDSTADSLLEYVDEGKLEFMRLIGVFGFFINDKKVFKENENTNFTFEHALIKAVKAEQAEAVQFVLDLEIADIDYRNEDGNTAIMLACELGDINILHSLVSAGANVDLQNNDGWTPLMKASQNNHITIIHVMLDEADADPHLQNQIGSNALMIAAFAGCLEAVELFITKGVDCTHQREDGVTAFMLACQKGHIEIAELLLNHQVNPNVTNKEGTNAFILACNSGHTPVVKLLLNKEVNPNVSNLNGWNALMCASANGHTQIVELLLTVVVVDINTRNNNSWNAFMLACEKGHHAVVELLLTNKRQHIELNTQNKNGMNAFMFACKNGHNKVVELLLQEKVNLKLLNNNGLNGFMLACVSGHIEIVKMLLKAKIDPNFQNGRGSNAFILACESGHTDVVKELLKVIDSPNVQDNNGLNGFMLACENGHTQVVTLLLKEHINYNDQNNTGLTALMFACVNGHIQIVELLQKIVDTNVQNSYGINSLMLACAYGHTKIVELLLQEQIDIHVKNCEGWNALMLASYKDKIDIVQLLLKAGLDPNIQSKRGYTALMLASSAGHYDVAQLLLEKKANPTIVAIDGNTAIKVAKDAEIAHLCQTYCLDDDTDTFMIQPNQDLEIASSVKSFLSFVARIKSGSIVSSLSWHSANSSNLSI